MTNHADEEDICCPKFDPAPWTEKTFEWDQKRFIKDRVFTFYYMPLNFGGTMRRLGKMVRDAGATMPDNLCLSDHTSKWNMDVYLAVDQEIPGAQNVTIGGKFLSKVYEGPYKETGNWCKDFAAYVKSQGAAIQKQFMWYTTCPKCAKKYGKNYVVIVGEVE
jgi:hypothetical protein